MITLAQFELTKAQIDVLYQNLKNITDESTKLYKIYREQCAELYGHNFGINSDEIACTICGEPNKELLGEEPKYPYSAFGEDD